MYINAEWGSWLLLHGKSWESTEWQPPNTRMKGFSASILLKRKSLGLWFPFFSWLTYIQSGLISEWRFVNTTKWVVQARYKWAQYYFNYNWNLWGMLPRGMYGCQTPQPFRALPYLQIWHSCFLLTLSLEPFSLVWWIRLLFLQP